MQVFIFWLYGVVFKVAPCTLLTVLSSLLIRAMRRRADRRRTSLGLVGRRRNTRYNSLGLRVLGCRRKPQNKP